MELLTDIPFKPDLEDLCGQMHLEPGSDTYREFADLFNNACSMARPKALYKVSYIENRTKDTVTVEGITFTSRILRDMLDKAERIFPYVVTCGTEIDACTASSSDYLQEFWIDAIKAEALKTARSFFREHIDSVYSPGKLSSINPGAGAADLWPIEEQHLLFTLLEDTEQTVGVSLTDSFLMLPNKSVSGILFPAEISFAACQLCPRKVCRGRRAPFDKEEYKKYHS